MAHQKFETIEAWKAACVTASVDLGLSVEDMWAEGDLYEMFDHVAEAFESDVDPLTFIQEVFEEDLADMDHEEQQFADSLDSEGELDAGDTYDCEYDEGYDLGD
jgi:hypothetical protein